MNSSANTVIDLLMSHRTIRTFKPDPVPDEHVRTAVEAGQMASTSSAVQAYSLIRVRDMATREAIAELAGPQPKIAQCGAFFVILGDTRRHRVAAAREGNAYDQRLESFLVAAIDASLFAEKMVIAFESMGYGICYIGGLRNDTECLDELLELPEGVYPLFGLCVGVPDESPSKRPRLPARLSAVRRAVPERRGRARSARDLRRRVRRVPPRARRRKPGRLEHAAGERLHRAQAHAPRAVLHAQGRGPQLAHSAESPS
jgi:FMN reductase (NADPH)